MKPIRIFTPIWGDEYIHRFERGLLKSLLWPKNRETLTGNIRYWHLFTTPEDMTRLNELVEATGYPFQLHGIDPIALQSPEGKGAAVTTAATEIMDACVVDGSLFMTAFSDIVFADGSIEPMFALAQRPRVAVTVPHMRVLPDFINLLDHPVQCAEMVTLAMKTAHPMWIDAEFGMKGFVRPVSNQFYGGVSWEKCGNYYLVQHVIPNVWLANIEQSDVELIRKYESWGAYDHNWPGKLIDEHRDRVIGSSDAAFMVEVTEKDKGISPISHINTDHPDAFHQDEYDYGKFHRTYRMCVSVFREG